MHLYMHHFTSLFLFVCLFFSANSPLTSGSARGATHLVDLLQEDVEDQISIRGNVSREAPGTIAIVAGDVECGLLANLHLDDTLVPAFDDLTDANGSDKVAAADGAVKLLALVVGLRGVLKVTSVLNRNTVASLGRGAGALLVRGLGDTHCAS